MNGRPSLRADLYRGTASFYDRFRLPYPAALIDDLCRRVSVQRTQRLLDVACGPGTVTFALSSRFAEVWAVDQEPETVDFAASKAADLGVGNVRWMAGRAEDIDPDEAFDLVTIGTAFHRLDRRRIADRAMRWLRPGGYLALLWAGTPLESAEAWQPALAAFVVDWMHRVGAEDRIPADLEEHLTQHPHPTVLEDAGFVVEGRYEFADIHDWTPEELIGLLYSTSLLSPAVVGDRMGEFEADLRARLRAIEPSGVLRERTSFAYDLASRPPTT